MIVSKYSEGQNIYRFNFHFNDIVINISNNNKKGYRNLQNVVIQTNSSSKEQDSDLNEFFNSDQGEALGIYSESDLQKIFVWWIFEDSSIRKLNCPFINKLRSTYE